MGCGACGQWVGVRQPAQRQVAQVGAALWAQGQYGAVVAQVAARALAQRLDLRRVVQVFWHAACLRGGAALPVGGRLGHQGRGQQAARNAVLRQVLDVASSGVAAGGSRGARVATPAYSSAML